jgi:hypothetical protein
MNQFGKETRLMYRLLKGLAFCIVAFAMSAAAQTGTPVTNSNNGVSGAVPAYSGSATLGAGSNSPISVSGSNVGIGATVLQTAAAMLPE